MLNELSRKQPGKIRSFSVSPENFSGRPGEGGKATHGTGEIYARELGAGWKISPSVVVKAGETFVMADIAGSGEIKHIWLTELAPRARVLILRIYWDGSETPSVEVPLGDFFANASHTEFRQLSSIAVCNNPGRAMNCYWTMPYRKGFRMTLSNISSSDITLFYQLDCEEKPVGDDALYFHAQFNRSNPLPYKACHTVLDGVRGSGKYVGTYLYWGTNSNGWWGEGEVKMYLDGDGGYPSICGTGTEDYFCGAYNFDVNGRYVEFTTPYSGLSKIDTTDATYKSNRRFSLYRWHINDPVYFGSDIRVTVHALGWRSENRYLPLTDDISSVAYWYSDNLSDIYPPLPDRDGLEII